MIRWLKAWLKSLYSPTTRILVQAAVAHRWRVGTYFLVLLVGSSLASAKFDFMKRFVNAGLTQQPMVVALWLGLIIVTWFVGEYALYLASLLGLKLERTVAIQLTSNKLDEIIRGAATRVAYFDP